ncbi:unnamed protein product [Cercopithifilaria johnstoni]|uniref:Uncharacterized protein n=1 Tax=Cercopithifilaria johnstoni TaxID=2874296 RepID=A0A8J2MMX8_9BILA|nr:unnamed protein product [Cercopithifilaria johnstoni]
MIEHEQISNRTSMKKYLATNVWPFSKLYKEKTIMRFRTARGEGWSFILHFRWNRKKRDTNRHVLLLHSYSNLNMPKEQCFGSDNNHLCIYMGGLSSGFNSCGYEVCGYGKQVATLYGYGETRMMRDEMDPGTSGDGFSMQHRMLDLILIMKTIIKNCWAPCKSTSSDAGNTNMDALSNDELISQYICEYKNVGV